MHCMAVGPDGLLYTGGDDHLVRRWSLQLLAPVGEPLAVHGGSVKALAAGDKECVVSGDATGELAVWLV
jgi:pleiotropic regulator 1